VPEPLAPALAEVVGLLLDEQRLVRAVAAGRRRAAAPRWGRVELRPVRLRAGRRLQVVRFDGRQGATENLEYGPPAREAVETLLAEPYGNWYVRTTETELQLRVTKRGEAQVHRTGAAHPAPDPAHDRAKPRLLDPADPLLRALGLTTRSGQVKPSRAGKYRQVEEFLRALDAVLDPARLGRPVRVVDLGCGNAYLTLATYRHLTGRRGLPTTLVGVDARAAARDRNQRIAADLGWADVTFLAGRILDAPVGPADVVLALHACDTGTDEALARAVRWRAPLVLVAPCCHHDLQAQLRPAAAPVPYRLITRHGLLREHLADVLTDAFRAALLRLLGYRVEVVEFVAAEHTPRNVLLRAVRTGAPAEAGQVAEYERLRAEWDVRPALARLLEPELSAVGCRPLPAAGWPRRGARDG
jgi:SAM-dependent methyltransferase